MYIYWLTDEYIMSILDVSCTFINFYIEKYKSYIFRSTMYTKNLKITKNISYFAVVCVGSAYTFQTFASIRTVLTSQASDNLSSA
jgi:hypothetical protein